MARRAEETDAVGRAGLMTIAVGPEEAAAAGLFLRLGRLLKVFRFGRRAARVVEEGVESGLVSKAAGKIDPIKLNHLFGKARHKLGSVVDHFGSQEAAFNAIRSATEGAVKSRGLTGLFETTVEVGGAKVTVRGAVVDGLVKIGTAFVP